MVIIRQAHYVEPQGQADPMLSQAQHEECVAMMAYSEHNYNEG